MGTKFKVSLLLLCSIFSCSRQCCRVNIAFFKPRKDIDFGFPDNTIFKVYDDGYNLPRVGPASREKEKEEGQDSHLAEADLAA